MQVNAHHEKNITIGNPVILQVRPNVVQAAQRFSKAVPSLIPTTEHATPARETPGPDGQTLTCGFNLYPCLLDQCATPYFL